MERETNVTDVLDNDSSSGDEENKEEHGSGSNHDFFSKRNQEEYDMVRALMISEACRERDKLLRMHPAHCTQPRARKRPVPAWLGDLPIHATGSNEKYE